MEERKNFFKVSLIKKSNIYANIYRDKERLFDLEAVQKHVTKCQLDGIVSFVEIFQKMNILHFIKSDKSIDQYFDCILMPGNKAWVSVGNDGHYRYFSKSISKITYSLDFIDMFGIYLNTNLKNTIATLSKMFSVEGGSDWVIQQKIKYLSNKFFIETCDMVNQYPNVNLLISSHIDIYKSFNEIGISNLVGKGLEYNGEAIFFSSIRYLKNVLFLDNSISVINQVINLCAVLGLIVKVNENDIPKDYINMSKEQIAIDKSKKNHVSFYTIPNIFDVIDEAEKRAEILVRNNIRYYTLSSAKVRQIFGRDFYDQVYVQKIFGKVLKAKDIDIMVKREEIEYKFKKSIKSTGFVSKELLKKETKNIKDNEFNKIWGELKDLFGATSVKPNKSMKKRHNLLTNENVLIIRDIYKSVSI